MNRENKPHKRKPEKITPSLKLSQVKSPKKQKTTIPNIPSDLAQQYLDIVSVIILAINADHKISLVNEKGCQVLGYESKDIIGKDWFDTFIPQGIREEVKSVFNQLMASQIEPAEYFENTIINSKGEERLIAWHNTMRRDESGDITGTLSSGEDITERKQAEEALKASEGKIRSLMDAAPTGITWADQKTRTISYMNRNFTELYGYTLNDIPTLDKWFVLAFPDIEYRNTVGTRRDRFSTTGGSGVLHQPAETLIHCKDGTIRYATVATSLVGDQILAIFNDITELKKIENVLQDSEEKYRLLVENANEAIIVIQDSMIIFANPKSTETIGYTTDELGSRPFIDFIYPDDRKMVSTRHIKRLKGEDVPVIYEFRVTDKNRAIKWVEINAVLISWKGKPATLNFLTDITDRRKAGEKLRKSEEKYRMLSEYTSDVIWILDINTRKFTYVSPSVEKMRGYTVAEALAIPIDQTLTPDSLKTATSIFREWRDAILPPDSDPKRERLVELQEYCKDGSIITSEARVAMLRNADGIPIGIFGVSRNITERKETEKALKDSEEKYRNLVENVNEGIWVIDKDANTTYVNSAMALMLGYKINEMIGRHLFSFMSEEQQKITHKYLQRHSKGIKEQNEFRFYKKDGSTIDTILSAISLYDANGQYSGAVAAVTDITNRKQAEDRIEKIAQEWRSTFDSIADFISIHDRDYNIVRINRAFIDLLKMKPQEIIGKKCYELIHGTMLPIDGCPHQITINTKKVHSCELFEPHLNMYLEITCAPILNKTGEFSGVVHVAKDITEHKRMELMSIQHEKLEALGELAGGIAHDFNNILTALLGNISLAKLSIKSEEKTTERLIEAEKATLRAKDLTQQLLTFAKGGAPVRKTASIIDILKDTTRFVLHGSNINPDFSIPDNLWNSEVDTGQISQVIHNLVLNAKEAMPNGGKLRIRAENIVLHNGSGIPLPEGNYIKIEVEDKGIGIPESNLQKIFDPYFTTKQSGSGLGLATSYSIIKNHQGFMSVDSKLGIGTTFTIYLPAIIKEIIPAVSEDRKTEMRKLKILVMDDEETILDIASSMLKYLGNEDIEFARNGTEAIELYKKAKDSNKPFDVIILDLTVPGDIGGKEVVKKLLEIEPTVRTIVSSGYSSDPIMANYTSYGFRGVVPKPYTIEELERVLIEVMQS